MRRHGLQQVARLVAGLLAGVGAAAMASGAEAERAAADRAAADWAAWEGREVAEVRFAGNDAFDPASLEDVVYTEASSSSGFFQRLRRLHRRRRAFVARECARDTLRLPVFYRREGFLFARARARITQLADGRLRVGFEIDEGAATQVDSVRVEGWPAGVPPPAAWLQPLPLQRGARWRQVDVELAARRLADSLRVRGRWQVEVAPTSRHHRRDGAGGTTSVTLRVDPGPVYRVGRVRVEGRGNVPQWLVDENLTLSSGAPFVAAQAAASRANLARLRLFKRVAVETEAAGRDSVHVTVKLEPGGQRSRSFGIGYGTEERWRLRALWADRNFLGGARRLDLAAKVSSLTRELEAWLVQPRFPRRAYRTELRVRPGEAREDIYVLTGIELALFVRRPLPRRFAAGAGWRFARYDVEPRTEDPELDPRLDREAELVLELRRVTADDPLAPVRGSRLFLNGGWSDRGAGAAASYVTAGLDVRVYRPFAGRQVLALRHRSGIAVPRAATRALPVWRRQFGGGATGMRSYERHTLGPLDANGHGLGGELRTLSVAELRLAIGGSLGAAVFGELGQVWRQVADARFASLRFGTGAGLRLRTPVGPVRLDVGFKTGARDARLARRVYHLSIGESF